MSKISMQFGELVRTHRRRLGMTQGDLAALAQVTLGTISLLEQGKSNCTFDLAERVGAVVGVELVAQARQTTGAEAGHP